ncbi:MAG: SapC family protein [Pseudomonadota bacterium]|nr:SapC family protein [Pseudomonadota bacterium]MDE3037204.1 SapC family protein [Pseudomonadota bacterium]
MFNGTGKRAERGAEADAPEITDAPPKTPEFPLFFSKPSVINSERHARAGIRANLPPTFARATNSIPLTVGEFIEAAKYYPVVFTGNDPVMPVVIVGLEQNNYFVGQDGKWRENTYIPAYVRKYPFVFMETPGSDQLTLCIDEGAPQFTARAEGDDTPLYEAGKPSAFTRNALAFCTAFQEQHALTRQFCSKLKELNLLAPNRSDAKLDTGRMIQLGGFQVIDQEKLGRLPGDTIGELHKQGWLPLMYYALLSTSSWRNLVNLAAESERKNESD